MLYTTISENRPFAEITIFEAPKSKFSKILHVNYERYQVSIRLSYLYDHLISLII